MSVGSCRAKGLASEAPRYASCEKRFNHEAGLPSETNEHLLTDSQAGLED